MMTSNATPTYLTPNYSVPQLTATALGTMITTHISNLLILSLYYQVLLLYLLYLVEGFWDLRKQLDMQDQPLHYLDTILL